MLRLPLEVKQGRLATLDKVEQSIASFIEQIINTPLGSCPADLNFGFLLSALRFEIINEKEGVVYNTMHNSKNESTTALSRYAKKISGSSKNLNTFAQELSNSISLSEPRLKDVNVSMLYLREEHNLYIVVNAVIVATNKDFEYKTSIKVWN